MKQISKLNLEELKEVYNKNQKLQHIVFDDMFENANFWNGEYLKCWERGSIDYNIGWDRGTYFKVKDRDGFLRGLKEAQKNYGLLADKWDEKIIYVEQLITRLSNLVYWDEINEERLNNRIDELIEELETSCYKRFMSEYEECFDNNNQIRYFLDFFVVVWMIIIMSMII